MKAIGTNGWPVFLSSGWDDRKEFIRLVADERWHKVVILQDTNTGRSCLPLLKRLSGRLQEAPVLSVPAGEDSKSPAYWEYLVGEFMDLEAGRDTLLLTLGGGMVTDLGGFLAGTYKRGIAVTHLPTSLLAMTDAAIGGKTALNFGTVKNVVGTFTRPEAVFVFIPFLQTLPRAELDNGMVEVLKMALVRKDDNYRLFREQEPLAEEKYWPALVETAIRGKLYFVTEDFTDQGPRQALNFGHTIGHALELVIASRGQSIRHGEAVLAGMQAALELSRMKCRLPEQEISDIREIFSHYFPAFRVPDILFDDLIEVLVQDKKAVRGELQFTLLEAIGRPLTRQRCSLEEVAEAWKNLE